MRKTKLTLRIFLGQWLSSRRPATLVTPQVVTILAISMKTVTVSMVKESLKMIPGRLHFTPRGKLSTQKPVTKAIRTVVPFWVTSIRPAAEGSGTGLVRILIRQSGITAGLAPWATGRHVTGSRKYSRVFRFGASDQPGMVNGLGNL